MLGISDSPIDICSVLLIFSYYFERPLDALPTGELNQGLEEPKPRSHHHICQPYKKLNAHWSVQYPKHTLPSDHCLIPTWKWPRTHVSLLVHSKRFKTEIFPTDISDVESSKRDSGYISNHEQDPSVTSIVRSTSIQDRSLRITRKRHQRVAKRRCLDHGNSTDTDEDVPQMTDGQTTDVLENLDPIHSDDNLNVTSCISVGPEDLPHTPVTQLHYTTSIQRRSWEIRKLRKERLNKRRSRNSEDFDLQDERETWCHKRTFRNKVTVRMTTTVYCRIKSFW